MERATALFVFIPFCKIKCTYCDFNVYANLARLMEPYAAAVVQEIERIAQATAPPDARTVYFGGGTPALVPAADIERILRALRASFSVSPEAEITLEANPGNVDEPKLRALRSIGINRLSLGVQSFDDTILRRLNRGHTASQALETYDLARRLRFDNINLDFIYGLPEQTLIDWRATLERALDLAPEHLSLYALKVEEGTGLERQIKRGLYPKPDDELAADMYELAEQMLATTGYEQYEISNWARPGGHVRGPNGNQTTNDLPFFASRHNLTYWRNEPYLGFGAGAHSCFGGERYWDVLSPVEYIERVNQGESAVAGSEPIGRELEMAETTILALRLNQGVIFDEFYKRYGEDVRKRYARPLEPVTQMGLVEWSKERVCLTPRGRLLSNEVFWRLLPDPPSTQH